MKAERSEGLKGHLFRAELQDPDGVQLVKPAKGLLPFQPNMDDTADSASTAGIVVNFPLLVFSKPGKYVFHVVVDDQEVGAVPLYLKYATEASSVETSATDAESDK